ncbi:bifunctional oligoribonuclease/PAP phosphatase NrnA [Listeria sp. PSOL-1]|uniref:DHH family phosphoesterase n=1 Tax=Listeria sp. PSOL-1 TaxID=1844999 RepID=UPI0013D7CEAD|nr:bifunctional oligoribonuclease/PAP phosphatase NrnA [Listeria sp. PSOL-1]
MEQAILNEIKKYQTIILHRHERPDPDAYGSQMGLAEIIRTSFPQKKVFSVGEKEASLAFLGEPDVIDDDVYKDALVIICDTANTARIADKRFTLGGKLIKIDHHPNDDPYGDILWINTGASSCSEMITAFYENFKTELILNETAARLLYAGIVGDTGRFLYPSTTKETMRLAAILVDYPFNRPALFNEMYQQPVNIMRLAGYIFEHFQIDESGAATIFLEKAILEEFQVNPRDASSLVSVVENAQGLKAWIMFIQEGDLIRARLRSKGPIINTLAKEYHGGGHPLASGATIHSVKEIEEMHSKLIALCNQF